MHNMIHRGHLVKYLAIALITTVLNQSAFAFINTIITIRNRRLNHSVSSMFMSTSPSPKKVAIIGGGISGLSAAQHLQSNPNYSVTLFDTGRKRVGGRCSSRLSNDVEKGETNSKDSVLAKCVYDHAAQVITIPMSENPNDFEKFREQIEEWSKEGIIKSVPDNSLVEVSSDNSKLKIRQVSTKDKFFAINGMGQIPLSIKAKAPKVKYYQDTWISPGNGVKFIGNPSAPQWTIQSNGMRYGTFDQIIISHNGKCADRLMSKTPAKDIHKLLEVDFRPSVPDWGGKKMTLNSIYSLNFAMKGKRDGIIEEALGKDTIGALLHSSPDLKFLTLQSKKYQQPFDDYQIYTILSSPKFAKKFKGPQENLPQELVKEVTHLMMAALEECLCLEKGSLENRVFESKLQLWGAAVPMNVWTARREPIEYQGGFIFDSDYGVGVCGDWLLDPSVAGAWESGRRLATWMNTQTGTIGLEGKFTASKAALSSGIGNLKT